MLQHPTPKDGHPARSMNTTPNDGHAARSMNSSPKLTPHRPASRLRLLGSDDYSTHTDCSNEIKGFRNLLVANRGEIAIRVFRTAHELGLRTTAVYAYEDRLGIHRYKADEAYQIGEPGQYTPVGAYLQMDEIIDIALKRGVDMIHPGYGFLSENSEFARRVIAAGIKWIGPTPETIDKMGDKTSTRQLAIEAGVSVVPGSDGIPTVGDAKAFIDKYGLPVILKAAFGGGGRGMRVVQRIEELPNAFERASSEALAAFGNGKLFVEKFLVKPRHIEVQLLGDGNGNVIHLYERDCSVQRRHQKVVEQAPAHNLPLKVRDAILADALKMAKHVYNKKRQKYTCMETQF